MDLFYFNVCAIPLKRRPDSESAQIPTGRAKDVAQEKKTPSRIISFFKYMFVYVLVGAKFQHFYSTNKKKTLAEAILFS